MKSKIEIISYYRKAEKGKISLKLSCSTITIFHPRQKMMRHSTHTYAQNNCVSVFVSLQIDFCCTLGFCGVRPFLAAVLVWLRFYVTSFRLVKIEHREREGKLATTTVEQHAHAGLSRGAAEHSVESVTCQEYALDGL